MENNTPDDALFKEYMKGVTPLSQDQHIFKPTLKKCKSLLMQADTLNIPYEHIYDPFLTNQDDWLTAEESTQFHRDGIAGKILKELRSGRFPWQAQLDLHRYTAAAAMHIVDNFLTEALTQNIRSVLIVHGKGSRTPNQKPILKNILVTHLRDNPNVLAYHSARPSDGGTGAVYVYLKRVKI